MKEEKNDNINTEKNTNTTHTENNGSTETIDNNDNTETIDNNDNSDEINETIVTNTTENTPEETESAQNNENSINNDDNENIGYVENTENNAVNDNDVSVVDSYSPVVSESVDTVGDENVENTVINEGTNVDHVDDNVGNTVVSSVVDSNHHVPDFKSIPKVVAVGEQAEEFNKVRTLFNVGNSTTALDKERRRDFWTRAGFATLVIGLLLPVGYIVYTMVEDNQSSQNNREDEVVSAIDTPDLNDSLLLGEVGAYGAASKINFMSDLAISHGYDLSEVSNENKSVFFIEQAIGNNLNPRQLVVSGNFVFKNNANCEMEENTDFCYISELYRGDDLVGNIYAFSNIFDTKFFGEVNDIREADVNGMDFSIVGNTNIAGNNKTALFLADKNGLGYVFVLHDSADINDLVTSMAYHPALPTP